MWPQIPSAAREVAAARARRYGSVPYSALGPARRQPPGPAVGHALTPHIDRWWEELGSPDPFVVVEMGAGDGAVAAGALETAPRCAAALRWLLVEPSARLRAGHHARLSLEPPELVLGPTLRGEDGDEAEPAAGEGPLVASLAEAPVVAGPAVVLAVDLLSTLPADRAEWRNGRWWEVLLVAADGGGLAEARVPLAGPVPPDPVPDGWRVPLQRAAGAWLEATLARIDRGTVVAVDRVVDTTAELAVPGLRPPSGEAAGVSLDQLSDPPPDRVTTGGALSPRRILQWDVGSNHG